MDINKFCKLFLGKLNTIYVILNKQIQKTKRIKPLQKKNTVQPAKAVPYSEYILFINIFNLIFYFKRTVNKLNLSVHIIAYSGKGFVIFRYVNCCLDS